MIFVTFFVEDAVRLVTGSSNVDIIYNTALYLRISFPLIDVYKRQTLMSSAKGPKTLPVGLLNLMQAQQSAAQYGIMYAGLVIVMLPTLILYICVQNKLTQGMTVGGLKG